MAKMASKQAMTLPVIAFLVLDAVDIMVVVDLLSHENGGTKGRVRFRCAVSG